MKRYTDTISGEDLYINAGGGYKFYYKDKNKTILHRIDGPAAIYPSGNKVWYVNAICHRLNGPAVERSNGDKAWYIDDVFIMELDKRGKIISRMGDEKI